jgi:hypothetical protein
MSDSTKAPISESFDVLFERISVLEAERDAARNLSSNLMQAGELVQAELAALRAENERLKAALNGILEFCDANPEGETAFEKAIIAARASTPKSAARTPSSTTPEEK